MMMRFLGLFMFIQVVLFGLEMLQIVQQTVVLPWTYALAKFCTSIMTFLDSNIIANGKVITSTLNGFAVSIEAGCNGIEAMIVLLAAVVAFPAPLLPKLWGLFGGFIAIQGLNVLRIISLFYLGQWNTQWFEWAHLYVWQALIMLDALVVFLIWVRYLGKMESHQASPINTVREENKYAS